MKAKLIMILIMSLCAEFLARHDLDGDVCRRNVFEGDQWVVRSGWMGMLGVIDDVGV